MKQCKQLLKVYNKHFTIMNQPNYWKCWKVTILASVLIQFHQLPSCCSSLTRYVRDTDGAKPQAPRFNPPATAFLNCLNIVEVPVRRTYPFAMSKEACTVQQWLSLTNVLSQAASSSVSSATCWLDHCKLIYVWCLGFFLEFLSNGHKKPDDSCLYHRLGKSQ